jgi:hypothetical protein
MLCLAGAGCAPGGNAALAGWFIVRTNRQRALVAVARKPPHGHWPGMKRWEIAEAGGRAYC